MSAFPPPTNGFYTGATYNSLYFVDSDTSTVTKEYLEETICHVLATPSMLRNLPHGKGN